MPEMMWPYRARNSIPYSSKISKGFPPVEWTAAAEGSTGPRSGSASMSLTATGRGTPMAAYSLPDLHYDFGALEPHYSAEVLELHHDKHHAAYVDGANKALEK